ncbi:hypothetical protein LR48_Vigan08g007500 [Vigna angularis]|uniref:Uncharacterized protein n=1 Tax=Phaseolus angularis TaxID=3914 RepID=A0A0L9V2H5_PHAAN|nr:hypothetical protein LR48_Vigan08g007500 [Vigna angularis]
MRNVEDIKLIRLVVYVRLGPFYQLPGCCALRVECRSDPIALERLGEYVGLCGGVLCFEDNPYSPHFPPLLQRSSDCQTRMGIPHLRTLINLALWSLGSMTPIEVEAVGVINGLPHSLFACGLIQCLGYEEFNEQAFDMLSSLYCFTLWKTMGVEPSKVQDPRSTTSSQATQPAKIRSALLQRCQGLRLLNAIPWLISSNLLRPLSSFLPRTKEKKKRSHKKGEKSSSKRSRREGSTLRPLSGSVFGIKIHIGQKANFHMNSAEWSVIDKMSEKEITNATLELSSRATMLNWYLPSLPIGEVLRRFKLSWPKRRRRSPIFVSTGRTRRELKEAMENAKTVQIKDDRMAKEYKKLKAKMDKIYGKNQELLAEKVELSKKNKSFAVKLK